MVNINKPGMTQQTPSKDIIMQCLEDLVSTVSMQKPRLKFCTNWEMRRLHTKLFLKNSDIFMT